MNPKICVDLAQNQFNSFQLPSSHKILYIFLWIRFPTGSTSAVGADSSFFDAIGGCGSTGDMLYAPNNAIQNAVVKAALAIWVS